MEILKKNAANLLKLKSLISLMVILVMCYGFLKGLIPQEQFMLVTIAVVTYYFSKKDEVPKE